MELRLKDSLVVGWRWWLFQVVGGVGWGDRRGGAGLLLWICSGIRQHSEKDVKGVKVERVARSDGTTTISTVGVKEWKYRPPHGERGRVKDV